MFYNPFKFYEDMLNAFYKKEDGEEETGEELEEETWVTCEYDVPEHLSEELDQVVAQFLKDNGYED